MTPVPTTAAAHLAMVEALRKVGEREMTDISFEGHAEHLVCSDCACDPCDEDCRTGIARAALEGWEKRPRLRDDEALRSVVAGIVAFLPGYASTRKVLTGRILDAIEAALFGTGRKAPAYGVLMCSECGCSSDNAKACNRDCPCHRTGPRAGGEPAKETSE